VVEEQQLLEVVGEHKEVLKKVGEQQLLKVMKKQQLFKVVVKEQLLKVVMEQQLCIWAADAPWYCTEVAVEMKRHLQVTPHLTLVKKHQY
jgi:hypothetical protein